MWEATATAAGERIALHLEFAETDDNVIQLARSASGENHVVCFSIPVSAAVFDRTFDGTVEGLSVKIISKNEPTVGVIL